MKILANLQNISLSFGDKVLFDQTGFDIKEYEKIGLIGLNGKGKSTLFKIISDSVHPDSSSPPFIYDKKKNLTTLLIPQELDVKNVEINSIERFYLNFYPLLLSINKKLQTIEDQMVSEPEKIEELIDRQAKYLEEFEDNDGWIIEQSYQSYLKKFDLTDDELDIERLSGGEKRKIALSIGLSAPHDLILWDEPTNHLDIETIEKFEDELKGKQNTFIMISHDRYILSTICDKIIHINRGKIEKFNGNYLDYIDFQEEAEKERQGQLTKLKNTHRRELAWMRQGIKARGTRSKKRVEGFNNLESGIQNLKDMKKKKLDLNLAHSNRKTKELLHLKDAQFSYAKKLIFKDTNLTLFKGDRVALIGKNGSGKSTFIGVLLKELELDSGELKTIDALKVNYFSQNRKALDENKTPFEIIGDGQDMIHLPDGNAIHINSYLDKFLFTSSEIRRPISTLSGGERNRLQLALFMKESADLWIFDEPTNDLDIETIETLENSLIEYKQAVIIVSHDRAFLDKVTTKSWILKNKTIEEFHGNYSDNADFLEEEEVEVIKDKPQQVSKEKKTGLSNKEKMLLENIEKDIEKKETAIDELQKEASLFDFTAMDEARTLEYKKLESKISKNESELDSLMQKWEELSQKV